MTGADLAAALKGSRSADLGSDPVAAWRAWAEGGTCRRRSRAPSGGRRGGTRVRERGEQTGRPGGCAGPGAARRVRSESPVPGLGPGSPAASLVTSPLCPSTGRPASPEGNSSQARPDQLPSE